MIKRLDKVGIQGLTKMQQYDRRVKVIAPGGCPLSLVLVITKLQINSCS